MTVFAQPCNTRPTTIETAEMSPEKERLMGYVVI